MAEQIGLVLVNPYTIRKMRTGGILSRLLRRPGLDLIGAEMFSPSPKLVEEFIRSCSKDHSGEPEIRRLIIDYIKKSYVINPQLKRRPRVLFLLFKGKNAPQRLQEEVGVVTTRNLGGESIRDTYGDFVKDTRGNVVYFEPAVITFSSDERVIEKIKIWKKYSGTDSGLLKQRYFPGKSKKVERTLVMLKPDNFQWPSSRVGMIIDHFSQSGLKIVGMKVVRMSVAMAENFYKPVREIFSERFEDAIEDKIKRTLASAFEFTLPEGLSREVMLKIKEDYAETEFGKIIRFMTGRFPTEVKSAKMRNEPGTEKCLAIVYEGPDAVKKIRGILGATDPSKAAPATIRKEFGQTIMVNTAHASDSLESAKREIRILKMNQTNLKDLNIKSRNRRRKK